MKTGFERVNREVTLCLWNRHKAAEGPCRNAAFLGIVSLFPFYFSPSETITNGVGLAWMEKRGQLGKALPLTPSTVALNLIRPSMFPPPIIFFLNGGVGETNSKPALWWVGGLKNGLYVAALLMHVSVCWHIGESLLPWGEVESVVLANRANLSVC